MTRERKSRRAIWKVNGEKLAQCRLKMGLTHEELSRQARRLLPPERTTRTERRLFSEKTIERYENSENGQPAYIKAIAQVLGKEPSKLWMPENLPKMQDYTPTFITGAFDEKEMRLFRKSIECYTKLFPDEMERADPEDILDWLKESHDAALTGDPSRDVYAVLHADEEVFGLACLPIDINYPWIWGAYFGVLKGWRELGRADKFLKAIGKYLETTFPTMKGMLFEIDKIDFKFLYELSSNLNEVNFNKRVLSNLRAVVRLEYFQFSGAYAILGRDGLPLPYWQPALREPLNASNEKEMILMVIPMGNHRVQDIELRDIFDFIYGFRYGGEPEDIPGYCDYVSNIRTRVEANIQEGCRIDALHIPMDIRKLLLLAKIRGFEDQLDL